MKLADILRSNGRLIQPKGTYVFNRWIREQLERGTPMDAFVRDLLTAEGSALHNPAANYYRISRDPESSVETTAQLFLGVRIQCAKCHNHPFERWTQDDYYGFAAFFARVKQKNGGLPDDEVIFASETGDVRQPRTGKTMAPKALGGPAFDPAAQDDRRVALAKWLTASDNPFFARSLVNRVWYHLIGRGIVEPVDDFRDSNPASNDELLDGLTAAFVQSRFDLKSVIRLVLNSRTYQLSARTNPRNADDALYFSHALARLLPAEVLLDAISTVTGTSTAFDGLPRVPGRPRFPTARWKTPSSRPSAARPASWRASVNAKATPISRRRFNSSAGRPSMANYTTITAGWPSLRPVGRVPRKSRERSTSSRFHVSRLPASWSPPWPTSPPRAIDARLWKTWAGS